MRYSTILILAFIISFASCSEQKEITDIFSTAEQQMDTYPDSALQLLKTIDSKHLVTKEGKARYALLYSQALDKNYIDVTEDSLINIAVEYYKDKKKYRYYSMLSYYYKARVEYNRKSYSQSIVTAAIAEKIAQEIEDYFYLGLIYRCFSDNYNRAFNAVEELRYIKMAYECFKRSGSQLHEKHSLMSIGTCYVALRDNKSAINIYKELIKETDGLLLGECLRYYADVLTIDGQFVEAKKYLLQLLTFPGYSWSVDDYCNLARIYNKEEKRDSVVSYLNKANEVITEKKDSVFIFRALYEMSLSDNNHKEALSYLKKIYLLQDSVTDATLDQAIVTSHRDFLEQEAFQVKKDAAYNRSIFTLWVVILIALIAILLFAVLYYYETVKRKNIEVKTVLGNLCEIKMELDNRRNDLEQSQQQITEIFSSQFSILDNFTNIYLDHDGKNKVSSAVLKELEKCIAGFSSQQRLDELNYAVNSSMNNIVDRLSLQVQSLSKNEINLFLYLCAQFSPRVISLFMNDKLENIYNKKSRLKRKIINSNAPDAKQFLRFF